ncbi:hypothetical protein BD324DRAFT_625933 [Kockovaella imperatae]|uniref:Gamma interferon inducible lysosomal thiol reductase-domain-containing protein n=1 Tax=Kockovaella imperatae TaxID=4999 RepID=A0A1Y1UH76_9TREE|nr:hypothetical protein BD324DRAFT_625933 [Kockovaella imperatae]ORX37382.1 hypothetical protein BD324DRAFT_625933 [Kockovaella imperatae]
MLLYGLLSSLSLVSALPSLWDTVQKPFSNALANPITHDPSRVNVTLYIMSRCSDSRICESVFEDVLRTKGIEDKINFGIQMVTQGRNESDPTGISCKHNTIECLGNAQHLCLFEHLPLQTFVAVLACENFESSFPGDIGSVAYTRHCAEASKVDWWQSGVGQCIQGKKAKKDDGKKATKKGILGKEAKELLQSNAEITWSRNITRACTIEIGSTLRTGGKRTCVVDDHIWTGCDDGHSAQDFVRVIEEEYKALQK